MKFKIQKFLKLINKNIDNIFMFLRCSLILFIISIFSLGFVFKSLFTDFYFMLIVISILEIYVLLFIALYFIYHKQYIEEIINLQNIHNQRDNNIHIIKDELKNKKNIFTNFNEYEDISYSYVSPQKKELRMILKKYKNDFLLFDIEENSYKDLNSINELCSLLKRNFRKKIKLFHPDSVGHSYYIDTVRKLQESFNFLSKEICKKKH